eukprot:1153376-Pelagomonas_calceolata.AAC.1
MKLQRLLATLSQHWPICGSALHTSKTPQRAYVPFLQLAFELTAFSRSAIPKRLSCLQWLQMGGDLRPVHLADRLLAGLNQPGNNPEALTQ